MDIFRLCGIAATAAVAAVILKSYKNEYSIFVGTVASVVIFAASLGFMYPILSYISEIAENTAFEEYISVLQKSLGICVITQITTDICDGAEMKGISQKLDTAAKGMILLLCMPLVKNLLSFAQSVLEN